MNSKAGRWTACWKTCLLLAANGMLLIAVDSAQAENVIADDLRLQTAIRPHLTFDQLGNGGQVRPAQWFLEASEFSFTVGVVTQGNVPLNISAGPDTRVGFGNAAAARSLHVTTPELLPALRLQSTDATFAHTWDIESSFFGFNLVDVTNSNAIPITVRSGAPTNSFLIDQTGKIGLGTNNPLAPLHVHKAAQASVAETIARFNVSDDAIGKLVISNASSANGSFVPKIQGTSAAAAGALGMEGVITSDTGSTAAIYYSARTAAGGQLSNRPLVWYLNNGGLRVAILANGHITANAFDVVSSRTMKDNITDLDSRTASEALRQLTPVEFVYKDDPAAEKQVGFIAEDVPEIVANADRKSVPVMDVLALVTRVVKDQQQTINEQKKAIDAQRQANDDQQKVIGDLLQRLSRLENQMRGKE